MDPVSLLVGGGLATVGFVLGRTRRRPPRPTALKCGCGHPYAFHDPATGHCHHESTGYTNGKTRQIQCTCRRYDGPLPVDVLAGLVFPPPGAPIPDPAPPPEPSPGKGKGK